MIYQKESPEAARQSGLEQNEWNDTNLSSTVQKSKRLLELFPTNRRSYMANLFYHAVRAGCLTPTAIIAHVKRNSDGRCADLPGVIEQNPEAVYDFALYVLKWESLTSAEEKAIREEKSTVYKQEYLKIQPPTEKQLRFLRSLSYKGAVESKLDAMRIIDELLKRRNENDTE